MTFIATNESAETMQHLPVRACSIMSAEHPEWGTFGVMEDRGMWYEIHGRGGSRILSKSEASRFWVRVS